MSADLHETQAAHWSIVDADDDAYLGSTGLDIDLERETGEIGYQVAPWARGRGVATAAARLVRDWAFDQLDLGRLEIAADVDNIASQRVAQATGLTYEGVGRGYLETRVSLQPGSESRRERRDHVLFGMLRGDPRVSTAPVSWPCLDDGLVVVRAFEREDAEAVARACTDPEIAHWIHRLPAPYSPADAGAFVAGARRTLVTGEQIRLAVADAASGELLGSVSLEPSWQLGVAELGYWVKREARRRGVATAAARLLIHWAFEELGFERIELQTYPGNAVSQRLAESLGFRREGLLRGALPREPDKDRSGRVATGPAAALPSDGALPARDDQVLFALLEHDWRSAQRA